MPAVAEKVRLELPVSALAGALATLAPISKKGTVACTSHVLMEFGPDGLTLEATDFDCWARLRVDCQPEGSAKLAAPGEILRGVVRSLPSGSVRLEVEGTQLRLKAGGSYTLQCLGPDEWPNWPEMEKGGEWTIPAARLRDALTFASWCTSRENSRPILHGILLDMKAGRVVATNGHVLAVVPIADPLPGGAQPNLSPSAYAALPKVLADDGDACVRSSFTRLTLEAGGVEFVTQLLAGSFPDYTRVIPDASALTFDASIDRVELAAAVARAQLYVGSDVSRRVVLEWKAGQLAVSSYSADKGEQRDEVTSDAEDDFRIAFDTHYLTNALRNLPSDRVRMRGSASERATLWSSPDDASRFYLIMPVRDLG